MVLECQHAESLHLLLLKTSGIGKKNLNILREKPHVWGLFIVRLHIHFRSDPWFKALRPDALTFSLFQHNILMFSPGPSFSKYIWWGSTSSFSYYAVWPYLNSVNNKEIQCNFFSRKLRVFSFAGLENSLTSGSFCVIETALFNGNLLLIRGYFSRSNWNMISC